MTRNHEYDVPDPGSTDWHEPLNDNFRALDADVEVRDVAARREEYEPDPGTKFLATDTGEVFVGDGDGWQPVDGFGSRIGSFHDTLRAGEIVGVTAQYQTSADPTDGRFESAAEAIQAVNDELKDEAPDDFGFVYVPSLDPDGNELEIDRTVVFGSRTEPFGALPRGWGFPGRSGPMLQCTIDDGSPMFVVARNSRNGGSLKVNATSFGGFAATANGNDAGFLRLENLTAFHLQNTYARYFDCPTADGVYVLDGSCYNSYINACNYAAPHVHCPDADIWVMRNDTGDGPPGEIKWGPGNSTYADPARPFNTAYRQEVNCSSMAIGGRFEGDGGPAKLYVTEGQLYVTGYFESGRSEGPDTDALFFDGYRLQVSPATQWGSNDRHGHIVHVGENASRVHVPTIQNDGGSTERPGDVIHIDADGGGSNRFVVPYPETFNGSVTYPEPAWSATRYPDGWQKKAEGTETIQPDGVTTLTHWAGDPGTEIRLHGLSIASAPDGDVRFQPVYGWDDQRGKQWVGIEERAGTEFELSWELHRRA